MSYTQQRIIKTIVMWFGLILMIAVSIPYLNEYVLGGAEKELGTKEGFIFSIGAVLAVGSKYWNTIIESRIGKYFK